MGVLNDDDLAVLEFEEQHIGTPAGAKERAVRERFGWALPRYAQRLHQVIDLPEAEQHDPLLVRRLRRIRDDATAKRARRRF